MSSRSLFDSVGPGRPGGVRHRKRGRDSGLRGSSGRGDREAARRAAQLAVRARAADLFTEQLGRRRADAQALSVERTAAPESQQLTLPWPETAGDWAEFSRASAVAAGPVVARPSAPTFPGPVKGLRVLARKAPVCPDGVWERRTAELPRAEAIAKARAAIRRSQHEARRRESGALRGEREVRRGEREVRPGGLAGETAGPLREPPVRSVARKEIVGQEIAGQGTATGDVGRAVKRPYGQRRVAADTESKRGRSRLSEREPTRQAGQDQEGAEQLTPGTRLRAAVRERMPLWWQTRCGLSFRAVTAIGVVLVLAVGLALHHLWSGRPEPVSPPASLGEETDDPARRGPPEAGSSEAPAVVGGGGGAADDVGADPVRTAKSLVVDVSGDVREPGVHRLPPGSRVEDAIKAAGGMAPGTSDDGVNRARLIVDGEQIVVGQQQDAAETSGGVSAGTGSPGASEAGGAANGIISLNSATPEQLETLPGIGPVLAQQIVEFRTNQGGFSSVEQLRDVSGIGEHRYATLRPLVGP